MKKIIPFSIFLAAFVYNFLFGNRYISLINEGYVYYGAVKILNGSILYTVWAGFQHPFRGAIVLNWIRTPILL